MIPPEKVVFAFRRRLAEVRRCFEGSADGRVRLTWRVDASGHVTHANVDDTTLNDPAAERCLSDFVRDLKFARREGTANASWTFVHGVGDRSVLERAERRTKSPSRNQGVVVDPSSPGTLPIEQIENVAENGLRLYAFCMRDGVNRNIRLTGRVLLGFTIDGEGRVEDVKDAGSDLGDLEVIDCVAEAFYALQFPEPQGGSVHLRYSLLLNED